MLVSAIGVTLVADALAPVNENRRQEPSWQNLLSEIAKRAATEPPDEGTGALREWFEAQIEERSIPPLTVLDDRGNVVAGRSLPPDARRLFADPAQSVGRDRRLQVVAFEHDGRQYRLVAPGPPERNFIRNFLVIALRPPFLWLLLLTAVALSVILSIAIARYLVHPLRTIEHAGKRLSDGDLSARVGPALGRRRDEIADFAAAFDQMAGRIESLVRAHKDLLRDVSHELRSPLARAHAALSLARQRTNGIMDEELDRLEAEVDRLDGMIARLLTFSRLDSGERAMQREPVDLVELLSDIVESSRFEAESTGRSVSMCNEEPLVIRGDPELLGSCFENVIRNAIRHTRPDTSVEIDLSRSEAPARYCCVTIRDYGDGVPEPQLQRIFEPFYRVDTGAGPNGARSGIGLAIAKRTVSLHSGSISAANSPDGGLVVSILLPMHRDVHLASSP